MTIPPLDATFPLQAAPIAAERLPLNGANPTPLLLALVKQALALVRSSEAWKKGSSYGQQDPMVGGPVQTLYCPSDMEGRLKKCGWHARLSGHPSKEAGLSFEDFYDGLGSESHTINEGEYIHDVIEVKKIDELIKGRAEIWKNSYNLPALTSNRDFVELIITLPLPPSPSPFSLAHEEAIVQSLSSSLPTAAATCGPPNHGRRSFIVISVPVIHSGAPEDPSFVRAKYASVEAVWEGQLKAEEREQGAEPTVEWFMAVQSDSSGKVPLMFQEMAMPSKISKDVPLFFKWAHDQKVNKRGKAVATIDDSDKATDATTTKSGGTSERQV